MRDLPDGEVSKLVCYSQRLKASFLMLLSLYHGATSKGDEAASIVVF